MTATDARERSRVTARATTKASRPKETKAILFGCLRGRAVHLGHDLFADADLELAQALLDRGVDLALAFGFGAQVGRGRAFVPAPLDS